MSGLPVAGIQKTSARVVAKTFGTSLRSGAPVSRMRAAGPPNAPGVACPRHNTPFVALSRVVPLVIGDRDTASWPWYCSGSGGHSIVVFAEPTPPLHDRPARCPALQAPSTHCGHGDVGRLVR